MKELDTERYPNDVMATHKSPAQSSVIITGLARNVAKVIKEEIGRLSKAFSGFKEVYFLVIESDSSDATFLKLQSIAKTVPNFTFITLGSLSKDIPNRIDRIAYCRNFAQKQIIEFEKNVDYVCVADLDGVNSLLTQESIESCWTRNDWDVCTANQTGPYYDIYALRAEMWCTGNAWDERMQMVGKGIHPQRASKIAINSRQKVIPKDADWLSVDSAFGGLAIYTFKSFVSGKYSSRDSDGVTLCEHVPFHQSIQNSGGRIFINPRMINSEGNALSKFSKRLKYAFKYAFSWAFPKLFLKWMG